MPEPGQPVVRVSPPAVALETAFLTSGLPEDRRQKAAARVTEAVRARGVAPALLENNAAIAAELARSLQKNSAP